VWTIETIDPAGEDWRVLLARSKHLLFHTAEWARATEQSGREVLCVALLENGEIKGGMLGYVFKVSFIRVGMMNVPYGALIGEFPEGSVLSKLLLELGRHLRLTRWSLVDFPESSLGPLDGMVCREDRSDIFWFDDRPLDERFRRQLKQDLRKIAEAGVSVRRGGAEEDLVALHEIYVETMGARGAVARYDLNWLESLRQELAEKVILFLAEKNDETIGGMLCFCSPGIVHGFLLVSRPLSGTSSANKALLAQGLRHFQQAGMRGFDFMPSGASAPGVKNFKYLFGAEEVALHHHHLVVSAWADRWWRLLYAGAQSAIGRWILRILK